MIFFIHIISKQLIFIDERLIEYDIDRVLYDERSQFQKVQIVSIHISTKYKDN